MKRFTFLMACVAVTLLSCQKEAPVVPEEETPEVQPIPAPEENVLVYHAGIGIPETKTTLYGTKNIYWKTGDKILAKVDGSYEAFTLNEGAGSENATFTYSGSGSTLVGNAPAFYGYKIGESGGFSVTDGTHVTLPDTYAWSSQGLQAPMMDADGTKGAGKFSLMGAVLKVDVENIPAAANKLVFTATGKNISGAFDVASEELVLTTGSKSTITITFTAGEATARTFFIPLPTGTYGACSVELMCDSRKIFGRNLKSGYLVLTKGDLMYVPAINAFQDIWTIGLDCLNDYNACYSFRDQYNWNTVPAGSKLRVYISEYNSSQTYWQLSLINQTSDWRVSEDIDGIANTYNIPAINTPYVDFTLSATAVSQLSSGHGLIFAGKHVYISAIGIKKADAAPEMVIWNGYSSASDIIQLPASLGYSVGKTMTVYYTGCYDTYSQLHFKEGTGWTYLTDFDSDGIMDINQSEESHSFELTSKQISLLNGGNVYLNGVNCHITKITLK